jgi:hypothetical protein
MKRGLLIILALAIILMMDVSFAEKLEIEFGETVSYENLKLYFYDIEDSRCPSDITCIWEGKVSAMIHISNQTHKIGGPLEISYPVTYISPYTVTLVDVKPHPVSTEKPDYVVTLKITKPMPDDELVDEQTCGTEKAMVDGICQVVTDPTPSDFRESGSSVEFVYVYSSLSLVVIVIGFFIIKKWRKRK